MHHTTKAEINHICMVLPCPPPSSLASIENHTSMRTMENYTSMRTMYEPRASLGRQGLHVLEPPISSENAGPHSRAGSAFGDGGSGLGDGGGGLGDGSGGLDACGGGCAF